MSIKGYQWEADALTASEVEDFVMCQLAAGKTPYVEGGPGLGKTMLMQTVADRLFASEWKKYGYELVQVSAYQAVCKRDGRVVKRPWFTPIIGTMRDPVSLMGALFPDPTNPTRAAWLAPKELPLLGQVEGPGMIFYDELSNCLASMQQVLMAGIHDHRLGDHDLDPSWVSCAAGNRAADKAGSSRTITPLNNRIARCTMRVDAEEWCSMSAAAGISPAITSHIRLFNQAVYTFNPKDPGQTAFASPRSWWAADAVLKAMASTGHGTRTRLANLAAWLGSAEASLFHAHLELVEKVPPPDVILKQGKNFDMPSEPGVQWAIAGIMAEATRGLKANDKKMNQVADVLSLLPVDFLTVAFMDMGRINRTFVMNPAMMKLCQDSGIQMNEVR